MPYEKDPDELGALLEKTSSRGTYMTGKIGDVSVVVFKNGNKKSEKSPDWRVLKAKAREPQPVAAGRDEDMPF